MIYKVWLTIEEIDEDKDHYVDVSEPVSLIQKFNSREEAVDYLEHNIPINGKVDGA